MEPSQPEATRVLQHSEDAGGAALGAEITGLCSQLYAGTYRLLVLLRKFDENGYWQAAGHASCAHWLHFACGLGLNAAREKVRAAHALAGLPKISAAFRLGEVSWSKVRAMTRIADAVNEDFLLRAARQGTAMDVERLVSQSARGGDSEERSRSNARYRDRHVTVRYEPDGSMMLQARLPAEQGALVMKALDLARERGWAEANDRTNRDGNDEGTGEASPETEDGVSAETRRVPFQVRQADALIELAESYLNGDPSSGSTADRYQVVLHVSAETLCRKGGEDGAPAHRENDLSHLEDGPRVSAETSRRIACDGARVSVFEDENGEPLSIGRKSRAIPPAIRRAVKVRDGGCRFPGCTHTRLVDVHHIVHWAHGGETALANLVLLCRHHHRLLHEDGFGCERVAGGKVVFRDAWRRELPSGAGSAL